MSKLPTVAFCGYGRAGKDEAGKYLGRVSLLRYIGSLSWVGKAVVARKLGLCEQEAWETRHQRRKEWFDILNDYRKGDPTQLVRDSLLLGEIVVGIRNDVELYTARATGLVTHAVWIERPGTPVDPTTEYGPEACDLTILNDSTIEAFQGRLLEWFKSAKIPLLS